MKKEVYMSAAIGRDISKENFDSICRFFPSLSEEIYSFIFAEGSKELSDFKELVSGLHIDLIYSPDKVQENYPNQFIKVEGNIKLSRADYNTEYFSTFINLNLFKSRLKKLSDGSYSFTRDQVNPLQEIGCTDRLVEPDTAVFVDRLKAEFDAQNFKGILFKRIQAHDDLRAIFWIIHSSIILPPTLNHFTQGDTPRGVTNYFAEFYSPKLLRYSASDLSPFSPFDVALTHECVGPDAGKRLVVSSRFRQWALDRGLQFCYKPVIIE